MIFVFMQMRFLSRYGKREKHRLTIVWLGVIDRVALEWHHFCGFGFLLAITTRSKTVLRNLERERESMQVRLPAAD